MFFRLVVISSGIFCVLWISVLNSGKKTSKLWNSAVGSLWNFNPGSRVGVNSYFSIVHCRNCWTIGLRKGVCKRKVVGRSNYWVGNTDRCLFQFKFSKQTSHWQLVHYFWKYQSRLRSWFQMLRSSSVLHWQFTMCCEVPPCLCIYISFWHTMHEKEKTTTLEQI